MKSSKQDRLEGKFHTAKGKIKEVTGKRRNLGTFPSLAGAQKHEREVQYFKSL